MWEAIRSNRRRSRLLILIMGFLLVQLGAIIGMVINPSPETALAGGVLALLLWLVLWLVAVTGGDQILLQSARAHKITDKSEAPRFWNVVEEMTIASGSGDMPTLYIIEDKTPNAFAVGRDPKKASVAVTSGLLERLNRDELQGVIAHEMGHIVNQDVKFMTLAGVMVGAIVMISDFFLRYLFWGGPLRKRSSSNVDGRVQLIAIGVAILFAILSPILAHLLYFACSRRREYLADASGARFTRYPEGLASALEKISSWVSLGAKSKKARGKNRTLAPMYIINPLSAHGATGLFSTHPPTEERVRILRGMGGMAGYAAYEKAYRLIHGKDEQCIGSTTLDNSKESIRAREAHPDSEKKQDGIERLKEVTDIINRLGGFLGMACLCGVAIHVPPGFTKEVIPCPRCGRDNPVPKATTGASEEGETVGPAETEEPLQYSRKSDGWEAFQCRCGKTINLSPAHSAPRVKCMSCKRTVEITNP